jgi:hypothetical protein
MGLPPAAVCKNFAYSVITATEQPIRVDEMSELPECHQLSNAGQQMGVRRLYQLRFTVGAR